MYAVHADKPGKRRKQLRKPHGGERRCTWNSRRQRTRGISRQSEKRGRERKEIHFEQCPLSLCYILLSYVAEG